MIDGSTSDFRPLIVKKPVFHHPKSITSPLPKDGSQCNSTEKTQINNTPIKKVGSDTPIKDDERMKLVTTLPRLIAV